MKHVLSPEDSSAAPESSADDELPDFRRWLAAVQSGLRTAPGERDVQGSLEDDSPRPGGGSPDFPAQGKDPGQTP